MAQLEMMQQLCAYKQNDRKYVTLTHQQCVLQSYSRLQEVGLLTILLEGQTGSSLHGRQVAKIENPCWIMQIPVK